MLQYFISVLLLLTSVLAAKRTPIVINTWAFNESTQEAWKYLQKGHTAIEALEAGCSVCERLQCDGTVGYGGSPDENGETTLDALIFDGATMNMGAVGALRNIKDVISVAKHVLLHTEHSILAGDQATEFAKMMGFKQESLTTNKSYGIWKQWKERDCQPNSWKNVEPDSKAHCGPFSPLSENSVRYTNHVNHRRDVSDSNHDTIGMVIVDQDGCVVAGTSTNGMTHKIPGRVGDSPIPGAGAYADEYGGASATGDGDVMMRFLPSFLAVEEMRRGSSPLVAAQIAIDRIVKKYPDFFGGVIAVNVDGDYGAACNGMDTFKYSVVNDELGTVHVMSTLCNRT